MALAYKFPKETVLALNENLDIPNGWAECNGEIVDGYQTPDLRGRFILGVGSLDDLLGNCSLNPLETKGSEEQLNNKITSGSTGGATEVELRKKHLPIHRHTSITSTNLEYDTKYVTKRFHENTWVGGQNNWFDFPDKNILTITDNDAETAKKVDISQLDSNLKTYTGNDGSVISSIDTGVNYQPDNATAHNNIPPYHSLKYIVNITDVE